MFYYAVRNGRNPGIYNTWDECNEQVSGFKGAIFKKFKSYEEARNYVNNIENNTVAKEEIIERDGCIYVDGSYGSHTHGFGWGSVINGYDGCDLIPYCHENGLINDLNIKPVILPVGRRVVIVSKFEDVTQQNNGAELLSAVVALRLAIFLKTRGIIIKRIYTDSSTVLHWSKRLNNSNLDPIKIHYINELIHLTREFDGTLEKIDGDINPADLGYHKN